MREAAVTVPDGGPVILRPTSLRLTEHRIGIIGGNGSGKSTLVRLLNNLVSPTAGEVLVDGTDVTRRPAQVRRKVGFCFSDPAAQLVMPTCLEDIELSLRRSYRDRAQRQAAASAVLAEYGLSERVNTSVHALSGGQRQLLAIAGVLATNPELLIADEPTTLLDLANTRRVADLLFGLEQQLILVTHDLDLVTNCDRVLVVNQAAVVYDGPPAEAVARYRSLALAEDPAL